MKSQGIVIYSEGDVNINSGLMAIHVVETFHSKQQMSWCFMSWSSLEPRCTAKNVGDKDILCNVCIKVYILKVKTSLFPFSELFMHILQPYVMLNKSPWFAGGWGWAMDSKHSLVCQASLTYLERSNLWLLGRFWWHFTCAPHFSQLKHKTEGLAASRLLHLLVCWISKGSDIFALQKHNIPRSGLYIMSRYEKTVSGAGAHEINTSWPPAPFESIMTVRHEHLLFCMRKQTEYQLMELQCTISWTRILLIVKLICKVLG